MKPKLSIIIPLYNQEKYIEGCLNSILSSEYFDFEIIVVDDESEDNSLTIAKSIANKDNRITVLHQEKKGVSAARNKGIAASHGEYITFVDADDYVDAKTYKCIFDNLSSEYIDIILFSTKRVIDGKINNENMPWANNTVLDEKRIRKELVPWTLGSKRNETWVSGSVWRLVIKKDKLNILFDEQVSYREDQLFCISLYPKVKQILVNTEASYYYVKHEITTTERYRENFFEESFECEKKIIDVLKDNKIFKSVLDNYKIQRLSAYSLCVSNLFRFDAPKDNKLLLAHIIQCLNKDILMNFSVTELLSLDKKSIVVYCLLKSRNITLISFVWRIKERKRRNTLIR